MRVTITLDKHDRRIKAIQREIHRLYDTEQRVSCISDEELRGYVEKYFMFESMIENNTYSEDTGDTSSSMEK
ncbi:MAG: hypothetical protein AEth_01360 [Candidatus Argoarchaeum ethanivorans]|uniref:Uncharacterized protein n=1 Tax=Candidatus Argoarchaeum ethanivorans TaxID=2608793 RepID=A0A8B3S0C0_9EURY|nr:MAG: hypothetical protein AEth_01360 [Candidatus Argoarchaeum ethanivorans]